jgi:hypothetical protein
MRCTYSSPTQTDPLPAMKSLETQCDLRDPDLLTSVDYVPHVFETYTCPILRYAMEEPVLLAVSGQTYNGTHLEMYLANKGISLSLTKDLRSSKWVPNVMTKVET